MRSLLFTLLLSFALILPKLLLHPDSHESDNATTAAVREQVRQILLEQKRAELGSDTDFELAEPSAHQADNQRGKVTVQGSELPLTESMVQQAVSRQSAEKSGYISVWNWQGIPTATASARGLDHKHHFANSYLVGFQPFKTKQLWVPLYTLALRKEYQYDHLQYAGLADIWQTSRQAYYQKRGDCEDHAILLADWLINLGVDARVALGTHKGEGHAWVVAIVNDQEYLLEATSKRRQSSWQAMPLAALAEGYEVEFQFNRDFFWARSSSDSTRIYRGNHWVKKSQFVRG